MAMKPATGLVVLIAVAVVLYAVALGLGLALNRDDGKRRSGGWQEALGSLTAMFAPRLELGAIACNGQPVRGPFKLTESSPQCELAFPRSIRHEYRKAELEFADTPESKELAVFVRAKFDGQWFKPRDRDTRTCFLPLPPAVPGGVERLPEEVEQPPVRLLIEFEPNKEPEGDMWECWQVHDSNKAFNVTVLEDGGRLRLTCGGCSDEPLRVVTMRMR